MVVIRLARKGAKKNPFYHIVAADSRYSRDGRYIEHLGYFNPSARGNETRLEINPERITHWVQQGAQPSDRISCLLKEHKQGARPAAIPVADYKKAQEEASAKAATKKAVPAEESVAPAEESAKPADETDTTAKKEASSDTTAAKGDDSA